MNKLVIIHDYWMIHGLYMIVILKSSLVLTVLRSDLTRYQIGPHKSEEPRIMYASLDLHTVFVH